MVIAETASLDSLQSRLSSLRSQLERHPVYASIRDLQDLRVFMESHVFAVWDFMSLLKSLQGFLTCIEVPWFPTPLTASRRFINQIVLGEESDEYDGRPVSHFELYLEAMERAGASTAAIRRVVSVTQLKSGVTAELDVALESAPKPARRFVLSTFDVIRQGSVAAQAAAFTFGREDASPSMFSVAGARSSPKI